MTTLLFPGQGSQQVGMGADLFDRFPEKMREADKILGFPLEELCTEEGERLNKTCFTQPALFVVSCLMFEQWREETGKVASFAAGHSVGEYAALYAAGSISFSMGLRMVQKRGELMHKQQGGAMAAVIGMNLESVEKVLAEAGLSGIDIANLNTPEQIILSGAVDDFPEAEKIFLEAGAARFIQLKVSGAFHSRYMKDAAGDFDSFLADFHFSEPAFPVISNFEARPYNIEHAREILVAQIFSPVRWVESIQYILNRGETEFLELGPGKVLAGLLRRIR